VRSRILLAVVLVLIAASGAVAWWFFRAAPEAEKLRLNAVTFADLPGWSTSDASAALAAFRRSCVKIQALPLKTAMAYAGTAGDWPSAAWPSRWRPRWSGGCSAATSPPGRRERVPLLATASPRRPGR